MSHLNHTEAELHQDRKMAYSATLTPPYMSQHTVDAFVEEALRYLTDAEAHQANQGVMAVGPHPNDVSTITVTGHPPGDGGGGGPAPIYNPGGGGPGGGGGGGGGGGFSTTGASAAANSFADSRIRMLLDPNDHYVNTYGQHLHDLLARIYDKAQAYPNDRINLSSGRSESLSEFIADLTKITFEFSTHADSAGADTQYLPDSNTAVIYINPDSARPEDYADRYQNAGISPADQGINYLIAHEIGHAAIYVNNISNGEPQANTVGKSITDEIGISNISDPTGGYSG